TTDTIAVSYSSTPTTYSVTVTDIFGFTSTDSLIVRYPDVCVLQDTSICYGDTVLYNPGLGLKYNYLWQDGSTLDYIEISAAGDYSVEIRDTNQCSYTIDTFNVSINYFEQTTEVAYGSDTSLCSGNVLNLVSNADEASVYLWSDASTNATLEIQTTGVYHLTVTNYLGCVAVDTVQVNIQGVAPVVDFIMDTTCLGDYAAFHDLTQSPDGSNLISWNWDFGNGMNSAASMPSVMYNAAGEYFVTLQVGIENDCSNWTEKAVYIHHIPQVDFDPKIACSNDFVQFSDQSLVADGQVDTWHWDFADLGVYAGSNPEVLFNIDTTYMVELTVESNFGCSSDTIVAVVVNPGPNPDFETGNVCVGESVVFYNLTDTYLDLDASYIWDFGDGNFSQDVNPSHTYFTAGSFDVHLISTHSFNHCQSDITKSIIVNPKPEAIFSEHNICQNDSVVLKDSSFVDGGSIEQRKWFVENQGWFFEQSPDVFFADTGRHEVILITVSDKGCADTTESFLAVHPMPEALLDYYPEYGNPPLTVYFDDVSLDAVSSYWVFDSQDTLFEQNPVYVFSEMGTYHPQLMAQTEYGCLDSAFANVKVMEMIADLAVQSVSADIDGEYLTLQCELANLSTFPVDTIFLTAEIEGGISFMETWLADLSPGQTKTYKFVSSSKISLYHPPAFACVSADLSGYADENPDNDRLCEALSESFRILPPIPNPVEEVLIIDFIVPFVSQVDISIFDSSGKLVGNYKVDSPEKGYNRVQVSTSDLGSGVYNYRVSFDDSFEIQKFIKQ
ncbi:MAG: hypothetical protein C0594_00695, partial [Marinilabiliales bacterium]